MTTTLRVIVDDILAPASGGIGRYTEELTRALIRMAPVGCEVTGFVSALPEPAYRNLSSRLPELGSIYKSALARRDLELSWRHGLTPLAGGGMVHSTSLLAPLMRHDRINRPGDQTVVTIHDTFAWTHPQGLGSRAVAWQKAMAKRAYRFADAVVVPTHAVARQLDEILPFGERLRVIGGAVRTTLELDSSDDAVDASARALMLPDRYLLAVADIGDRSGLRPLVQSLSSAEDTGLPLLLVRPSGPFDEDAFERLIADAGAPADRVRLLGSTGGDASSSDGPDGNGPNGGAPDGRALDDADLAVVFSRATAFVFPPLASGFGLPMLEALHFGVPVVHSDAPALVEVAAGAGVAVPLAGNAGYPDRLARAVASIVGDPAVAERLRYLGLDRARAFSWREAAQRVWQLHADL